MAAFVVAAVDALGLPHAQAKLLVQLTYGCAQEGFALLVFSARQREGGLTAMLASISRRISRLSMRPLE